MTKYTQVKKPNYLISSTPGWCELYVESVFGYSGLNKSAEEGFGKEINSGAIHMIDMNKLAKGDIQSLPKGVSVPLFISLSWEPNGHVVVWDGKSKFYTSGLTNGLPTSVYGVAEFGKIMLQQITIPEVGYYYSKTGQKGGTATRAGWSMWIGGKQLVKEESDIDTSKYAPIQNKGQSFTLLSNHRFYHDKEFKKPSTNFALKGSRIWAHETVRYGDITRNYNKGLGYFSSNWKYVIRNDSPINDK